MSGIGQYFAVFLVWTIQLGPHAPPPHLTYSPCDNLSPSGPRGWAQTKLHFASDFMRYSIEAEPSNCDYYFREIEAHVDFTARLL